jgi:uncharacterized protein YgiM (DUF1202 family)
MKFFRKSVYIILILSICLSLCAFSASASELAYGAATVSATSLNVRSGPDSSNSRVTVLSKGTIVVILEKTSDTWYKINYHGSVGYVAAEYLTDVLTAENFSAIGTVSGSSVRMRASNSTDSDIVKTYDDGTSLEVIGINNGWYKISDNGTTGYIRSDFMDITGGSSSGSSTGTTLGQQIVNLALSYVGYSYVYGAESPSVGFDCSGLVYYVYGQYGYKLSRTASKQYANNGTHVSKSDLQQGDLVFFSSNGKSVTHVGIYIGDGQFVHASTSKTGVIISDLNSDYYTRVWFGASRIV